MDANDALLLVQRLSRFILAPGPETAVTSVPGVDFLLWAALVALVAAVVDVVVLDRLLARLAGRTHFRSDDRLLEIVHRPILALVILGGLNRGLPLLPLAPSSVTTLSRLVTTVGLLVVGAAAAPAARTILEATVAEVATDTRARRQVMPLLDNVSKVVIVLALAMAIFTTWQIDITPLVASAGIAGLAVALAAQDSLSNFLGGMSIMLEGTYRIGDYLVVDNQRGEVVEIGMRSTRIRTRDDVLITIPNSTMSSSKIVNQSGPLAPFRIRIPVGVAYDSDPAVIEETMMAVAEACPLLMAEPAPRVRFRAFGDSALDFELLGWVKDPAARGRAVHEVGLGVLAAFREKGIEIPYPRQDVMLVGSDPT